MNYFLHFWSSPAYRVQSTDRQTESEAYEPTMQIAQVGSKTTFRFFERRSGYKILSNQGKCAREVCYILLSNKKEVYVLCRGCLK